MRLCEQVWPINTPVPKPCLYLAIGNACTARETAFLSLTYLACCPTHLHVLALSHEPGLRLTRIGMHPVYGFSMELGRKDHWRCLWQRRPIIQRHSECGSTFRTLPQASVSAIAVIRSVGTFPEGKYPRTDHPRTIRRSLRTIPA